MGKNNVISLENRQAIADPLTQIIQEGVKAFISQAVEAVLPELLTTHSERTIDDGRVAVVRNGYLTQREKYQKMSQVIDKWWARKTSHRSITG